MATPTPVTIINEEVIKQTVNPTVINQTKTIVNEAQLVKEIKEQEPVVTPIETTKPVVTMPAAILIDNKTEQIRTNCKLNKLNNRQIKYSS